MFSHIWRLEWQTRMNGRSGRRSNEEIALQGGGWDRGGFDSDRREADRQRLPNPRAHNRTTAEYLECGTLGPGRPLPDTCAALHCLTSIPDICDRLTQHARSTPMNRRQSR
jgi:hypothetical protein